MLDQAPYVAKAERHSGKPVLASSAARRRSPGSFIGEAGLLCAFDDGIAFVVDGILEPGEVTTTPLPSIQSAELSHGAVDTSLAVETTDGRLVFEGLDRDGAIQLAETAGLPLNVAAAADDASGSAPPSEGLPDLTAHEPPSSSSEMPSEEGPPIHLATVREASDALEEPVVSDSPAVGLLAPARDRKGASDAAGMPRHDERPSRSGNKRRRRGKAAAQRSQSAAAMHRWVPVAVVVVLALAGLQFHWSVAVLLGCIGYPVGLYVAERANKQPQRSRKRRKQR